MHVTHYERLGVDRDVDEAGLRAAWRARARQLHPDHGGDTAAFQELAHAFEVLSDPVTRQFYDEALALLAPSSYSRDGAAPPAEGRTVTWEEPGAVWPVQPQGSVPTGARSTLGPVRAAALALLVLVAVGLHLLSAVRTLNP